MADRLMDKVAIVTGSDSGIGQATAEAFAREGAATWAPRRRSGRSRPPVGGLMMNLGQGA